MTYRMLRNKEGTNEIHDSQGAEKLVALNV